MSNTGKQRIVYLSGEIDSESAGQLKAELLALDNEDPVTPIELLIDSPGGSVMEAFGILDTINNLHAPVHTVCHGLCRREKRQPDGVGQGLVHVS